MRRLRNNVRRSLGIVGRIIQAIRGLDFMLIEVDKRSNYRLAIFWTRRLFPLKSKYIAKRS